MLAAGTEIICAQRESTFKSLLDVDSLLCTRLEVGDAAFRLAEGHRALGRDLVVVLASVVYREYGSGSPFFCSPRHRSCCRLRPAQVSTVFCHIYTSPHTNGKLSGSIGLACTKNSSLQLSSVSKLFELFTSYTSTQQSAPR
jgi:hypothetical protein